MNNITTLGEYIESLGCGALFAPMLGKTELAIILSYRRVDCMRARLDVLYFTSNGGIKRHDFAYGLALTKSEICLLKLHNANKQS